MNPAVAIQNDRASQRGLSLIEILVALGLSLLLLAGVLVMFTGSKSTYETNDRIARLQENGRTAISMIAQGARSAGYVGCAILPPGTRPLSTLNATANTPTATIFGQDFAINGFDYTSPGTWTPALNITGWTDAPTDGSDVLLLMQPRRGVASLDVTTSMPASTTADLNVTPIASGIGPFNVGQILMVADCTMRTYFQVTGYDAVNGIIQHQAGFADATHPGNQTNNLQSRYTGTDEPTSLTGYASVISMQSVIYYVRPNATATGNSLWRRIDNGISEELIEGVDAMQVMYGVDTIGDDQIVDNYVNAAGVVNLTDVINIRIALLVRSLDEYGTIAVDTNNYTLLDSNFQAPGDHRLRQVFATTLTLRNAPK